MIAGQNAWLLSFDNLSSLQPWQSDALCRVATGGGYSTRELYSNDEERIIEVCRPVSINGIGDIATRSDLLERSVLVKLPVIPPSKRLAEGEFWRLVEAAQPRVLGALLDGVVRALANENAVRLATLPRMADFARWSAAAAPAFGWTADQFLEAYAGNMGHANSDALDGSVVVPFLRVLVANSDWRSDDGATALLEDLRRLAQSANTLRKGTDATRQRGWSQRPRDLAGVLERLAPALRSEGVFVEWGQRATTGKRRTPLVVRKDRTDNAEEKGAE